MVPLARTLKLVRPPAVTVRATDLEIDAPFASTYLLPCIAGHVGADTAGAILAEGPHRSDALQLLVDVGTNAEIVFGNSAHVLAASSPTGPAFEGAQISAGMRATVDVVTVDPLTGLSTEHAVNANGATYFMGGSFEVSYANNQFMLQVIGQGGDYPLAAGTTSTNVTVDVQVGSKTVTRNANVGTVNNSQINASAAAYTALATGPSDPDEQYVATQMLLLTPGAFASAGVAISSPTNPYALPNVTMSQLFQAGDVAMKRLMQLRETPAAPAAMRASAKRSSGVTLVGLRPVDGPIARDTAPASARPMPPPPERQSRRRGRFE